MIALLRNVLAVIACVAGTVALLGGRLAARGSASA